jgi:hypothetical protein
MSADGTESVPLSELPVAACATSAEEVGIDEVTPMPFGLLEVLRRASQGIAPRADPDGLLSLLATFTLGEFAEFREHWSRWSANGEPFTRRPRPGAEEFHAHTTHPY